MVKRQIVVSAFPVSLFAGAVAPLVEQSGDGRPVLLLHGGAGPATMRPLLSAFASRHCILPTHPGFDGTSRPDWLSTIADLSLCYLALLDALGLSDVLVVGNSAGGWIAAEMATRRPSSICGIVLIDAVGLAPTTETGPIVDPMSVTPQEMVALAFADPTKSKPPTPEAVQQMAANQSALTVYAGDPFMHDPSLGERLASIIIPALVLWGEQDRIATPAYGEAYARALATAEFVRIADAGHLPQLEQPDLVAAAINDFHSC